MTLRRGLGHIKAMIGETAGAVLRCHHAALKYANAAFRVANPAFASANTGLHFEFRHAVVPCPNGAADCSHEWSISSAQPRH